MNHSCFDKTAYRAAKDRIIELIKNSHDWKNTEGFIADGIICPNEYEKQSVRILCILAESYGYDGCEVTYIETQPIDDVLGLSNPTVQTPRKLSTLLWLLQQSFEQGSKIKWDDMPWLFTINKDNTDKLQKTLSKVAWVNVKKASQPIGTKMDPEEVYVHALRNQTILCEQIQIISPHLIIVCGAVAFHALNEMKLLGSEVVSGQKWKIQDVNDGPLVLEVSHPSTWRGYEKLYGNFEDIYAQMDCRLARFQFFG